MMKRILWLLLSAVMLLSLGACAQTSDPAASGTNPTGSTQSSEPTDPLPPLPEKLLEYKMYDVASYTAPITDGTVVYNESALVVLNQDGSYPDLSLLYPIEQVISVRNAMLDVEYVKGVDYDVVDGKLRILPGSTMPMLRYDQMYLPNRLVNQSWASSEGGWLYYSEGVTFHRMQLAITYTHSAEAAYQGFVQPYKGALLPQTAEKLQKKEPMNITFIGDSITYGLNSSGIINSAPFTPGWGAMTVEALNTIYGQSITFTNLALGGTTAAWGEGQMEQGVIPSDPDLLVIAFGMNDGAGSIGADGFVNSLRNMVNKMKAANPKCEILLVSTTLPNPKIPEAYKTQKDYEDAMMAMEETGVAVMQMTSVHKGLLEKKNFYDISGSNLNHPNDFLTRMYAQSCINALVEAPVTAEPIGEENKKNPAPVSAVIPACPTADSKTALLQVLVNEERWVNVELTPYLGQDNTWIEVPLEIDWIREGINQFALNSNAFNRGNLTYQSLDILSTGGAPGVADSFVSTNNMVYWNVMHNRRLNLRLELFDGNSWINLSEDDRFDTTGGSLVIGKFTPDGCTYLSARNLEAPDLSAYTKARLMVNAHVGSRLLDDPDKERPDIGTDADKTTPFLKVQLNQGPWVRYDLTPEKGKDEVWVTVDMDMADLYAGTNSITVDSNVNNTVNNGATSVDLFFTASNTVQDTYLSMDSLQNWIAYTDRYANIYMEVRDAADGEWVAIGKEQFSKNESTVIGYFDAGQYSGPYNMRRIVKLDSLKGYDAVRAVIQIHVGSNLTMVQK